MRSLCFILVGLLFFSCNKDNDMLHGQVRWPLIKVEGATSGQVNQTIGLTVYWPYFSGNCDVLDRFETSRHGNIFTIEAYGHTLEQVCTANTGVKTRSYDFVSATKGVFELRFLSTDTAVISHIITIN